MGEIGVGIHLRCADNDTCACCLVWILGKNRRRHPDSSKGAAAHAAVLEAFPIWVLGPGRMRRMGRLGGSALVPACSAGSVERAGRKQMQTVMIPATVCLGKRAASSSGTYWFGGLVQTVSSGCSVDLAVLLVFALLGFCLIVNTDVADLLPTGTCIHDCFKL